MPLTPFPVEEFGGLNLTVDPTELGMSAAVDMLNVDTTRNPGKLLTRGGMTRLGTGTASYHRIAGGDPTKIFLFRNDGVVLRADTVALSTGTVSASTTWGGASTRVTSTANYFDTISGTSLAIASRSGSSNEAVQYTGTGVVPGSPRYVAITPWDDRFVEAHFTSNAGTPSGANGTPSTVFFSNPLASTAPPIIFTSTNWLQVAHDDGEEITGMVAWRELLFVVKRQTLFVFYGTSTLSDGTPVFNYRTVNLPARTRATTNGGGENMIAAGDGVYLLLGDGVYRTTGGAPVRVSDTVTPIFDGTGPAGMLFPAPGDWNIGYAANRVYLNYTAGGAFRSLVYDTPTGTWLLWDPSAGQSAQPTNVIEWVDANGLPITYVAAGGKIYSLARTVTTDDGAAIPWSYQTGYSDAGGYFRARIISSGERKRHFKTDIEGSGTVTHQVLALNARPGDLADPGGTVTLGTAPATARGSRRRGVRGTYFAHKLSGTGPAVVSGLTYWLANVESDT